MNRRRSERLVLQIRLLVLVETEPGTIVRFDAFTFVVNAHGGLMEMSLKVAKGQKLVLSNPVGGFEQSAKVVAVRSVLDGSYAVAFEFNDPAPQFWPVSFPPKDWGLVEAEH